MEIQQDNELVGQHMSWLVKSEMWGSLRIILAHLSDEYKNKFFEAEDELSERDKWRTKGALEAFSSIQAVITQLAELHEAQVGGEELPPWAS